MFRALCVHHHQVKIVLCSIWYHHTGTSEWSKMTKIQFYKYEHMVVRFMCEFIQVYNIRLSGGYYKKYKNS